LEYGLTIEVATQSLRIAEFLYNQCVELHTDEERAISDIDQFATRANLSITPDHKVGIALILSYNQAFETITKAPRAAITSEPHFSDMEGSWGTRIHRTRTNEIVKVPVLTLTFGWHDPSGELHNVSFSLHDRQWEEIKETIQKLAVDRNDLKSVLED